MAKKEREIVKAGVSCILSPESPGNAGRVVSVAVTRRGGQATGGVAGYTGGRPRRGQKTGWEGRETFNTSLALDVNQYDEVCKLAKKEGVTIKVIMYELLKVGLLNYKSR